MLRNFFTFSRFTLFIALCISAIAAWYSVIGLTAIFAGAVMPIIIMGGILEVAKITTTVWLHRYWDRAGYAIRTYLTIAVVALACLTSMGIFGLLSKAHLEQGVVSGDVQSRVALLDEKIKISKENIDANRKALRQLDEAVDQVMARSTTETGADKAVQIRRQQSKERTRLIQEIEAEQKKISALNEERAPIATQLRKVEAEVGPIKYIAALVYGDNPDVTTLERAVRWVIILIVVVFDPLAIILILAANNSLKWEKEARVEAIPPKDVAEKMEDPEPVVKAEPEKEPEPEKASDKEPEPEEIIEDPIHGETDEWKEKVDAVENSTPWPFIEPLPETKTKKRKSKKTTTVEEVKEPEQEIAQVVDEQVVPVVEAVPDTEEQTVSTPTPTVSAEPEIITDGVTKEAHLYSSEEDYVVYDGKTMSIHALQSLHPELVVRGPISNQILFGTKFPDVAKTGDIYTRVDVLPHKTYKFNGYRWIQVDRTQNTSYLQNIAYIQYLIAKLDSGEYDPETLTSIEQDEISTYLQRTT